MAVGGGGVEGWEEEDLVVAETVRVVEGREVAEGEEMAQVAEVMAREAVAGSEGRLEDPREGTLVVVASDKAEGMAQEMADFVGVEMALEAWGAGAWVVEEMAAAAKVAEAPVAGVLEEEAEAPGDWAVVVWEAVAWAGVAQEVVEREVVGREEAALVVVETVVVAAEEVVRAAVTLEEAAMAVAAPARAVTAGEAQVAAATAAEVLVAEEHPVMVGLMEAEEDVAATDTALWAVIEAEVATEAGVVTAMVPAEATGWAMVIQVVEAKVAVAMVVALSAGEALAVVVQAEVAMVAVA